MVSGLLRCNDHGRYWRPFPGVFPSWKRGWGSELHCGVVPKRRGERFQARCDCIGGLIVLRGMIQVKHDLHFVYSHTLWV